MWKSFWSSAIYMDLEWEYSDDTTELRESQSLHQSCPGHVPEVQFSQSFPGLSLRFHSDCLPVLHLTRSCPCLSFWFCPGCLSYLPSQFPCGLQMYTIARPVSQLCRVSWFPILQVPPGSLLHPNSLFPWLSLVPCWAGILNSSPFCLFCWDTLLCRYCPDALLFCYL